MQPFFISIYTPLCNTLCNIRFQYLGYGEIGVYFGIKLAHQL
jgi:hypothetical protein